MSEKKLYLIDDDPVFRLVAKKIIEKNGTFGSVDFLGMERKVLNLSKQ